MGNVGNDEDAALNQVAKDRGMMKFMKGIVDRVTSPKDEDSWDKDIEDEEDRDRIARE